MDRSARAAYARRKSRIVDDPNGTRRRRIHALRVAGACLVSWLLFATGTPVQAGLLQFGEVHRDGAGVVNGLGGIEAIAISPDGAHVYAGAQNDDAVAAFSRDPMTGYLTFVGAIFDTDPGVDGLDRVRAVAVSPDGAHVYAAGYTTDAVTVLSRNASTGALSYVGVHRTAGLNGAIGITVSPDGSHVYVAAAIGNAVTVLSRDAGTGALTFVASYANGTGGITSLTAAEAVVVSPDGAHVYVAAQDADAVTVFSRNVTTGALTLVEFKKDAVGGVDGLDWVQSVAVSPDGAHVYTASRVDKSVAVFSRNPTTGALTYLKHYRDGVNGINGLDGAEWVEVSSDGTYVHVASDVDSSLAVFARNPVTGDLTQLEVHIDGVAGADGLAGGEALVVGPDGKQVYVAAGADNAIGVFTQPCGNGLVEGTEQCDDGNNVDGDCCSATCGVEPAGQPCADDGNICTDDKCNGVGFCLHVNNAMPCDDGNYCTVNDMCSDRECSGAPRDCSGATSQQCKQGVCDEATDQCVVQNRADGVTCSDGNLCTQTDTCQAGTCTGSNPVACTPVDECHSVGVCDPPTGICSNPAKANGTPCTDGDLCTQASSCQAGVCAGSSPIVCTALDQCHVAGVCNSATGLCSNPPIADGTSCDDGSPCSLTDTCEGGTCFGSSPVVCTALDQCHGVGVCSPTTGLCSNPPVPNGTGCNDGNLCTQTDTCFAGTCTGAAPVVCMASDQCHVAGVCQPTTGLCSNPEKANGTACDDSNACTQTDACASGLCTGSNPVVCTPLDQCHVAGVCSPATGACSQPEKANGTACNDGNLCTQTDACQAGSCAGSNPVVCSASDQCHVAGVCDPASGTCSNPLRADGTACDDGNACTQTDACQAGFCTGANPVVCMAVDGCHTAGVCSPSTGICSDPAKADGAACDDGNACTLTDTCQAGVCTGSNAVVCAPLDQCHSAGACDPATGVCSNPLKANGTPCNDADLCTQTDTCQAGACTGTNPIVCSASDQCHSAGTCNPATGVCSDPQKANGTPCDDGNLCTTADACTGGVCVGSPVVCTGDACHDAGTCNPATGLCVDPQKPNGTPCNDGNLCTQSDACQAGSCTGANPVVCSASDQCHVAGVCDPASGICSNPLKANGTACNDANACTQADTCQAGTCTGMNPIVCTAVDQCHAVGVCDPATGFCSNPAKANGSACDDMNLCTQTDACLAGACVGADPVSCTAGQCHTMGVCNPATGACSTPPKPSGTPCNDGDLCTQTDSCQGASCVGVNPVVCGASDQCHDVGTCDPATGSCSDPAKPNGAACDDGDLCTQSDTCQSGACMGANPVACAAVDQCHTAGLCNPATGVCSMPARADGTPCSDGDLCTQSDTCQAGACVSGSPVMCGADQCHAAGTCDPATGLCSTPPVNEGQPCDDGDACTQTDTCVAGSCMGSNPVVCTALDQCHTAGVCDPATGLCPDPQRPDGAACDDGNACTRNDTCLAGFCTGADPVICTPLDQCHTAGTCDTATGVCSSPLKADGTACNDGNLCTQSDTCQAGSCTGASPVVCSASDQCHVAGTCDPATGTCSNPNKADGTPCDDGNLCTRPDQCVAGACTSAPVVCTASDQCHRAGVCDPTTGVCSNPLASNGTPCFDGNACTQTDTCQTGACAGANPVVCGALDQCHGVGTCDPASGICSTPPVADGTPCNDSSLCTAADACQAGTCTGTPTVVCAALDQCHAVGVCNPLTGACSHPVKAAGAPCNDGSLCTTSDVCNAGVCAGTNPIVCTPLDQCHAAGSCNPATGVCSDPPVTDGTGCDDGDLCTMTDTCEGGVCLGSQPVVCAPLDACHVAGTCDSATGLCDNPLAPDGRACDDGNLCTQTDACAGGLCVGSNAVVCAPLDQCHDAGVCDPATGTCSDPAAADGRSCNDGNLCTRTDACAGGVCSGSDPVSCTALDLCHVAGVCDAATGICSTPLAADGTACDDGNPCTQTDSCLAGTCVGGNPKICTAIDACHNAGVCDPATGLCSSPAATDGTTCDDGNLCTQVDTCLGGTCVGGNPIACTASDACHNPGACNPTTGLCSDPPKVDGTPCDDGSLCSGPDTCQAGVCTGPAVVVCAALDQCHAAGICNPTTGVCSNPPKPDGSSCNDGNLCTQSDTCEAGSCFGSTPVTCAPLDGCHTAGVCNPATGTCSSPVLPNGTVCDDGNPCTQVDSCLAGSCVGGNPKTCAAIDACHNAGVCNPATGACTTPPAANGTACNDGNRCTQSDACLAGVCLGANPITCTAIDQCHGVGTCDPTTGLCSNPPVSNGTACQDGNLCTNGDICQSGVCTTGAPVVCAIDQCRNGGVCDPTTGICSGPPKANGTPCDDGSLCTMIDTCDGGACVGGESITCTASDACHLAGTCNPATGTCSNPPSPNGTPCDDGNLCTQSDTCVAGVCTGASPIACAALDQCHQAGTCDPSTGACSNPLKADGSSCDDGNLCTLTDTCQAGSCVGTSPVTCTALDQCHDVGVCNPATGLCSEPLSAAGRACDDGAFCTVGDICNAGVCQGVPRNCAGIADACNAGVCNEAAGACERQPFANGTACADGAFCTVGETCQAGVCRGAARDCSSATDQCNTGACDEAADACAGQPVVAGTACDDGLYCTIGDHCSTGSCVGTTTRSCSDGNSCTTDTCDEAADTCLQENAAAGEPCSDGLVCNNPDVCDGSGTCIGDGHSAAVGFVEAEANGVAGVTNLNGPRSVAISPDGNHLYAGARDDDAIVAFERDDATGALTFAQSIVNGAGGVNGLLEVRAIAVSADGNHVYAAGSNPGSVAVFSRDATGTLSFIEWHHTGGIDSLASAHGIALSPDGEHLYVTSPDIAALTVFSRDAATGMLTLVEAQRNGFGGVLSLLGAQGVVVSPDGEHVYVASNDDASVTIFDRDPSTGMLSLVGVKEKGQPDGTDGLKKVQSLAISADGNHVYTASGGDNAVVVFSRSAATGMLTFVEMRKNGVAGVSGISGAECVTVDSAGEYVYVAADGAGTLAVFGRDAATGRLTYVEKHQDGVGSVTRLNGATAVVVSPDTAHVYVAAKVDDAVTAFADICGNLCDTGTPPVCTPLDQCHAAGECVPSTGACSDPALPDGTPCDDGDLCTLTDVCLAGTCTGTNTLACVATDSCHGAGSCDPATGVCTSPALPDGTPCEDGDLCTQSDTCQGAVCVGSTPLVCSAIDQCHDAGFCNPATGLCTSPPTADGAPCDDGNHCTLTDRCQAGACIGADPALCTALDQCHTAGTCDPATGMCSNPLAADGTPCGDGNLCTHGDACLAGLCTGATTVTCQALDQCHGAGACDPTTGVCSNPPLANGTACDDSSLCTRADACQGGFCIGTDPVLCSASDQCHGVGQCDPASGLCSDPTVPNGRACDDGDLCTRLDSCLEGLCIGSEPVTCMALDACHVPGICDPATGACSQPVAADGTACDDGNLCTQADTCLAGVCTGADPIACTASDQCHVAGSCDPATGVCSSPVAADGTPCDDGDLCTQSDACLAGVCTGSSPVVCAASDQCHVAGTCDPATGLCSDPSIADGTACNDGDLCSGIDSCIAGVCIGADPVICTASDQCHTVGSCNPATGVCSDPPALDGTACDDGNLCTQSDACLAGACTGADPVLCTALDQCHAPGVCVVSTGVCTDPPLADGIPCDDGDLCSRSDSCLAGVCTGADPVVCSASDQCHVVGACDPATGLCSDPATADGAPCDDGNLCTQSDSCLQGFCTGANAIVCSASDQCHVAGACDPATGLCSDPAAANGAPCNDGNLCTQSDSCLAGVCTGANAIVCSASDQCHVAGTCDGATGLCSNPEAADGAPCDDGNLCTQSDACLAGICAGNDPVVCSASDDCHAAGTCDPETGICSDPELPDGAPCEDGDLCTLGDSCSAGSCTSGVPIVCTAPGQCRSGGVCDPATGMCSGPPVADGMPCDDGSLCTQSDTCIGGVCIGLDSIVCTVLDDCHVAGSCDPATGLCSDPRKPNGAPCQDNNPCTQSGACQSGTCIGSNPVVCTPIDACHAAGQCDPATGQCSNPLAPDGTPCDDGNPCTESEACQGGACVGGQPVVCQALDACHTPGTCDPTTGLCSDPRAPNGAPCEDGNPCTLSDTCQAGVCTAGNPMTCTALDGCHVAGTCDPATGLCSNPLAANGTACDDGNPCTQSAACSAGICTGTNPIVCAASDQCHVAGICDPATGLCSDPPIADGTPCNDGDPCTQSDSCLAGFCTGADPVICTASDQCHIAGTCSSTTGLCSNPAIEDETPCDDGNLCTRVDACRDGYCEGADPVVCTAIDACHAAGVCDPATGLCSDPAVADDTPCDDGNACTQSDTCQGGLCLGTDPVVCIAIDQCHAAGACDPATGLCSDPAVGDDTPCDDNNACTQSDSCFGGVCTGAEPVICGDLGECYNPSTCDPATGICDHQPVADGAACDDGSLCTQSDACLAGICVGGDPITCSASDQCHAAGTCDPATGLCSDPALPDGAACDDGSLCTQSDACLAGLCVGSDPVTCSASDQCHAAGTCDPATGLCSDPTLPDGAGCDDANLCTQSDTCLASICVGGDPIICSASDQCHAAGTCDPATGLCSDPTLPDGAGCDDANLCTQSDTCAGGVCVGADPVICAVADMCNAGGICMPSTGLCSEEPAENGTPCDDGNLCTLGDSCQGGTCTSGDPVVCTASDACHMAGTCDPASGLCTDPALPDGTACDDANLCTQSDACLAGLCVGGDPVTCSASDPCHAAGTCDPATGLCSDPALPDGTACDDANLCTQRDACLAGFCVGGDPVTCGASDPCHAAGICDPATGLCSDPALPDGTACDDANLCTQSDACLAGVCVGSDPVTCSASDQCHAAGTCDPATGSCSDPTLADGTACDDANLCTQSDACLAGVCVGGDPVTCSASDQCHAAGTCDPATGSCSDPTLADGTACDDANLCTQSDACLAGVCVGSDPVTCSASDQCHAAGTCDPATGLCSDPALPDGTACDDANLCTQSDACLAGVCVGGDPVTCSASDQCHAAGTCDPATGSCSDPTLADGTACDDANLCTQSDACLAGVCVGGDPVTCSASDQCHAAGTCDPATGSCSDPTLADGTACDDANLCTQSDACLAGVCVGGDPVTCSASDQCHAAGTCDPATGSCSDPTLADGTACDDANLCTQSDACLAGFCVGGDPVTCSASDQCHAAGTCDPATGLCSDPTLADGTPCDDANLCTQSDACLAGVCVGGDPVTCSASDQCHAAGTCDPATGSCSDPTLADGTACDDANLCTQSDACLAGVCVGGDPVTCSASDQCHAAGTCDPATGLCSDPTLADGTACDDANLCTQSDACLAGVCLGSDPVTCSASDQCHAAGTCDPATGLCSDPTLADGTPCDDANLCTQSDTCAGGVCVGADPVICAAADMCNAGGICMPSTGLCSEEPAENGTPCDDGNLCTLGDSCQGGTCTSGDPVVCTASDACHMAGTCDPTSGLCTDPALPDGTACDDANFCTQSDACLAGVCVGGDPVTCSASDQCHAAGTCDPATGLCSDPTLADGTACDDANLCTQRDACLAGVCIGSDPVTCSASDPCHAAGTCDPATGLCSGPTLADGTACDDGSLCTQSDACLAGLCVGGDPITCSASDPCHAAGTCDPATGLCSDPALADGTACDDGSLCTQSDACLAGLCVGGDPITCSASDPCHAAGTCDPATGLCSDPALPDGAACDDANLCTQSDACLAGLCVGGDPVTCSASDQCHAAGTCDPATGLCFDPALPDGTACDDANLCTQSDACLAGLCVGGDPVTCSASDQCHAAGTCDPATGSCSDPTLADGTACDDANLCTQSDACLAGFCVGGDPITCSASDSCHVAGICNPGTGLCDDSPAADGSPCDDGDLCTRVDTCMEGSCIGGDPVVCTTSDPCREAGTCDPATGLCSLFDAPDGTTLTFLPEADASTDIDARTTNFGSDVELRIDGKPGKRAYLRFDVSGIDGLAVQSAVIRMHVGADAAAGGDLGGEIRHVSDNTWGELTLTHDNRPPMDDLVLASAGEVFPSQVVEFDVTPAIVGNGLYSFGIEPLSGNLVVYDSREAATGRPELVLLAGTACDDGNACTLVDMCQDGECIGMETVTCTAVDECHNAVCDTATGECSSPAKADGSACDDGNLCTTMDSCIGGVCGGEPVACAAVDGCHDTGVCDPATGLCSNPPTANGTTCDDGNACTQSDSCQAGACVGNDPVICTASDQCHAAGACDPATGLCSNPPAANGTTCDDGNACTQSDSCQAGACVGSNPVICTASDQCHATGACNPATGLCSNPPAANGTTCDDGNACTQSDSCQAGACVGSNPVICTASDQCHATGACNPATGLCSNPSVANGTTCDDGNACTQSDTCWAGACVGNDPVICAASDQCHAAGACNPATGLCSNPSVANGTTCDDGNACTQSDSCQAGACVGSNPVTCTASDQCHAAGVCNPATGLCSNPPAADGSACNDGNACTQSDSCQVGACVGSNPVTCTASDQCHAAGACDPATGLCSNPPAADGSACNDGNGCTRSDRCTAGACIGADPVICAVEQCRMPAVCNPASGQCSSQPAADGTTCDDGAFCSVGDTCQQGACRGMARDCSASTDSCAAGVCDENTNACVGAPKPDGTVCDDGAFCTVGDTCTAGTCKGTARACAAAGDPCSEGSCDEAADACTTRPAPDGAACDDENACTQTDTCRDGVCVGANPVTCDTPDQCHDAGRCDPSTGRCSDSAKADGTPCDDGDDCSTDDACIAGECLGDVLPDSDDDGFCDAVDLCPDMPDPAQTDADGDGIGDVCQCTSPAPGNCIAGGGSARTDCLLEVATAGPLTLNKRGTKVTGLLSCADGDPACDMDEARDGRCTFGVALCFGNTDPRYPRCSSSEVRSIEVLKPDPARSLSISGRANAQQLEGEIAAVGLEVTRRGRVIASELAPMGSNRCTSLIQLVVPAGHALGKGGPFKQQYEVQAQATNRRKDKDRFSLACE